jgi:hypothetical protein
MGTPERTSSDPVTLHLPFELATDGFNLAKLLASDPGLPWSEGRRLLQLFQLKSHEKQFVLKLLRESTNLWIFRCNQHRFCGDFVLVDMSSGNSASRKVYVVELKRGVALIVGGRDADVQLANYRIAVEEIAGTRGIVEPDCKVTLLYGDNDEVLEFLKK